MNNFEKWNFKKRPSTNEFTEKIFIWPKQIKVILLKKVNMIRSPFVILGFSSVFPRFYLIRFWFQSAVISQKSKRCHAKQPKTKPPKSPEVWILNFWNFSQSLIMCQDRVILVADNPQWENIYLHKQLTTTNKPDHLKDTFFIDRVGLSTEKRILKSKIVNYNYLKAYFL